MQLIVKDAVLARGGRTVAGPLSFAVKSGVPLIVTGPNGAGKTTLLRALAGVLPLESGQIAIDGGAHDAELGEQCHYAGHRDAIKSVLTVYENIAFWAEYLGGEDGARPRAQSAIEAFALDALADTPVRYLSAGQKRRTGLARLVAAERPVWLLDEPTVSLDTSAIALLTAAIGQHLAGGGLVVAATHMPLGLPASEELRMMPLARAA